MSNVLTHSVIGKLSVVLSTWKVKVIIAAIWAQWPHLFQTFELSLIDSNSWRQRIMQLSKISSGINKLSVNRNMAVMCHVCSNKD
jgi:hypothetical protein